MNVYLQAALISLMIFLASMFLVKSLDEYRLGSIKGQIDTLKVDIEDSKLFLLYSQTLRDNSTLVCQALETQISERIEKNQQLIFDLAQYEEANVFSEEYYSLKNYFISKNLELWLYLSSYKQRCDNSQVSILYFYPDRTPCPECEVQANILTEARNRCTNIKVFALPVNVDLGILNIIKNRYNITSSPTLVINEEFVHKGIMEQSELMESVSCNAAPARAPITQDNATVDSLPDMNEGAPQ